jgi:hypothetical protein
MLARVIRSGALLGLCLAAITGCAGESDPTCPRTRGIIWISWTVRGQLVSDASCRGIDHLTLTMRTLCGAVEIDPIPCIRGLGWEYDNVPEGDFTVVLDAFDTRGVLTLEGAAPVSLTPQKPPMPTPIDLH